MRKMKRAQKRRLFGCIVLAAQGAKMEILINLALEHSMTFRHGLSLSLITLLLPATMHAQAKTAASPVGPWVAQHPSKGGFGSWWQFRAHGTLTMYVGVVANSSYSLKGDVLTHPDMGDSGADENMRVRFEGNKMYMKPQSAGPRAPEMIYERVGAKPSGGSSIVGEWKNVTAATLTGDSQQDAMQKIAVGGSFLFTADGTEHLRIPFRSAEGTWNANNQIFQVTGELGTYHFDVTGGKLVLSQPPDNEATDTYLPDYMKWGKQRGAACERPRTAQLMACHTGTKNARLLAADYAVRVMMHLASLPAGTRLQKKAPDTSGRIVR